MYHLCSIYMFLQTKSLMIVVYQKNEKLSVFFNIWRWLIGKLQIQIIGINNLLLLAENLEPKQ